MGLFDGGKKKKFIAENRVPADKEPLLTVGAILVYANNHPAQCFRARMDIPQTPRDLLATMGIHGADDLRGSVAWLFEEGNRFDMDEMFKAYRNGDTEALSGVQIKMYEGMIEYMQGNPLYDANKNMKKLTREFAESVDGCVAWDIERAAFWARMAANAGFIPEDEAWEILGVCYDYVKSHFACWAEYLVSFIIGRSLVMCNPSHEESMQMMFDNGALLGDLKWGGIWAMYPLG